MHTTISIETPKRKLYKRGRGALSALLALSLAACAGPAPDTEPAAISPGPMQTQAASNLNEPAGDAADEAVASAVPGEKAYLGVLQNEAMFYSVDRQSEMLLQDFLADEELYGVALTATEFAVLDLDGDGAVEVVLGLEANGNMEFYEILHYAEGTVYGYNIVYRGLEALKADGTFYFSNGAADGGYGKLRFGPEAYEMEELGETASDQSGEAMAITYRIGDETVAQEAYDAFAREQDAKEAALWHGFSPASAASALPANP